MSAEKRQPEAALKVAVLWGLFGCTGVVSADETESPDMEFLEYLGSWEESDEDWLLFADQIDKQAQASNNDETENPTPQEEELAELDDES